MQLKRRLMRSRPAQRAIGVFAAEYLRLVWNTTRFIFEPVDAYERGATDKPVIIAMWHGQHFLSPFVRQPNDRVKALISRHRDGEINAIAAEHLGIETIRGSGDSDGRFLAKGGASAFTTMLQTLEDGCSVALTADVPKVARIVGKGIIKLAIHSGRPIYPLAIATKWRKELNNWDRTAINLPFGQGAVVAGEALWVPPDADDGLLESRRLQLQQALNDITARAYALVKQS
jgi:lysophospholipid acyltransferase (LPLAT)-like uncharacterized protein